MEQTDAGLEHNTKITSILYSTMGHIVIKEDKSQN